MASLSNAFQANVLAESINQVVGEKPSVVNTSDMTYLRFTPEQQKKVRAWVESQVSKKREVGKVKIEFEPVIYPIAIKKVLPFIILLLIIGVVAGRITKK